MLLDLQLKQLYDTNLSIKENLESLKNQGIKIGKSSLYNWVKSQKYSKNLGLHKANHM